MIMPLPKASSNYDWRQVGGETVCQLAHQPSALLMPEAKIRSAAVVTDDVQEQAAVAVQGPAERTAGMRQRGIGC